MEFQALAVTIESMRRAGFGRVVVGGVADLDAIEEVFLYLLKLLDPNTAHNPSKKVAQIGHMEVGCALAPLNYFQRKNVPRAALMGLQDAFFYSDTDESERTTEMKANITAWLGSKQHPSYWRYVFFTEPDQVLQARPGAMPQLKEEVDKGSVILPHRLQPIPHESDVRGMKQDHLFVPEKDFPNVLSLDPNNNGDACCDENKGRKYKPGLPPHYESCGREFWWMCGFRKEEKEKGNPHRRFRPYELMRLSGGTEIVSLAGSEHARRCIPKKNFVCQPSEEDGVAS